MLLTCCNALALMNALPDAHRSCRVACTVPVSNAHLTLSEINRAREAPDERSDEIERKVMQRIIFCCLDIGGFSKGVKFFICCVFVFLLFIGYGYWLERIFSLEAFRPFGFYLTLLQFGLYSLLSFLERNFRNDTIRKTPLQTHVVISLLTVGTMGFSNAAVGYLNYPTQVVFKCCKLIPVLVGGILIQGKEYDRLDFLAALLMTIGVAAFTLTDVELSPSFSPLGVFFITIALVMDAGLGNVQEKAMKTNLSSNLEIVFFSYSIGTGFILLYLVCMGQLIPAIAICSKYPLETYGYGMMFGVCGYFGIQFVLTLISITDAFVAVSVTTMRKVVSIVLSFILFTKPFSSRYLWSGLLVLGGIYLHQYKKFASKQPKLPLITKDIFKT